MSGEGVRTRPSAIVNQIIVAQPAAINPFQGRGGVARSGCTFDSDPPSEAAKEPASRPKLKKLDLCELWLKERLTPVPVPLMDLRTEAEEAGYSAGLLDKAAERLGVEEYILEKKKW
jgi:hypothetical protein